MTNTVVTPHVLIFPELKRFDNLKVLTIRRMLQWGARACSTLLAAIAEVVFQTSAVLKYKLFLGRLAVREGARKLNVFMLTVWE